MAAAGTPFGLARAPAPSRWCPTRVGQAPADAAGGENVGTQAVQPDRAARKGQQNHGAETRMPWMTVQSSRSVTDMLELLSGGRLGQPCQAASAPTMVGGVVSGHPRG